MQKYLNPFVSVSIYLLSIYEYGNILALDEQFIIGYFCNINQVMAIHFFTQAVKFTLRERTILKLFLADVFKQEGKEVSELTYVFCSDEQLLTINRQYLKHDFYTDIITFDLSSTSELVMGEIHISIDRVRENAKEHQQTFNRELHRVILHGALHLCGYKDKTSKDERLMRQKEEFYLNAYGL